MSFLYLTADKVGMKSGGGAVTHHESEALKSLGSTEVWGRGELTCDGPDPWGWDGCAFNKLNTTLFLEPIGLCHGYSGTFTDTIRGLKDNGVKVAWTCAAHDVQASRQAHLDLGVPYDQLYPHLVQPDLWKRYSAGYFDADVLVCPSTHSEKVLREQGAKNRIVVIPHGCDLPEKVAPLPASFRVGYLGAIGPDKGLIYLLQAWKNLNYKDATLVIGGKESTSPGMMSMLNHFGGGNVQLLGWVENVSDFYDQVSLYVQPSVSEGWGIEVVEAAAHGRAVLCSTGAGAADFVCAGSLTDSIGSVVPPCNVGGLTVFLDWYKKNPAVLEREGAAGAEFAKGYHWDKIRSRYVGLWKGLLV